LRQTAVKRSPDTLVLAKISRGRAQMANKPEYVDLIGEATRQHRRRAPRLHIIAKPEVEET